MLQIPTTIIANIAVLGCNNQSGPFNPIELIILFTNPNFELNNQRHTIATAAGAETTGRKNNVL